ncbi:hypothetical protein BGZ75_002079, partial [Mortierella antarctica]
MRRKAVPLMKEQARLNQQSYIWNKLDKAAKPSQGTTTTTTSAPKITTFTWEHFAMEEDVPHSNIDSLLENHHEEDRQVVFSGTDYGLVKMSRTVPISKTRLAEHQNYFGVLG